MNTKAGTKMEETKDQETREVTEVRRATPPPVEAGLSGFFDERKFGIMVKLATIMANAPLVPKDLKGKNQQEAEANCFLIVEQAMRWDISPTALAQCAYVLNGKVGFEAKVISAVVNSNKNITRRLSYTYKGEGPAREVTVSGMIKGEKTARTITGTVEDWATNNAQWKKKNKDQMLSYRGAREWARRHAPDILMGAMSADEVEEAELGRAPAGEELWGDGEDKGEVIESTAQEVSTDEAAPDDNADGKAQTPLEAAQAQAGAAGAAADSGDDQGEKETVELPALQYVDLEGEVHTASNLDEFYQTVIGILTAAEKAGTLDEIRGAQFDIGVVDALKARGEQGAVILRDVKEHIQGLFDMRKDADARAGEDVETKPEPEKEPEAKKEPSLPYPAVPDKNDPGKWTSAFNTAMSAEKIKTPADLVALFEEHNDILMIFQSKHRIFYEAIQKKMNARMTELKAEASK